MTTYVLCKTGCLAVFKVTARDQGHYTGPAGAFVTYCNISCSALYTTLPHNLIIKDKLVDLIERIFQRECSLYIACNDRHTFLPLMQLEIIIYGLVRKCVKVSSFS